MIPVIRNCKKNKTNVVNKLNTSLYTPYQKKEGGGLQFGRNFYIVLQTKFLKEQSFQFSQIFVLWSKKGQTKTDLDSSTDRFKMDKGGMSQTKEESLCQNFGYWKKEKSGDGA